MLRHAVSNGTGWRADSLGDLGTFSPTWNHMYGSYPRRIRAIQDLNAWKNGPIAFEPPAAVAEFVEKDWPLRWIAYRLSNNNGDTTTIVGSETVDQWMPGVIELFTEEFFEQPADLPPGPVNEVVETIPVPEDLPSGTFTLSIAVVGEVGTEPVVQLGIKGRDRDGWYPLSKLTVVR